MRPKAAGYRNIGNRVWHCISVLQNAADISPLSVVHDLNAKLRGCCPDFVATPLFQSPALQHAVQALESCTSRNTHTHTFKHWDGGAFKNLVALYPFNSRGSLVCSTLFHPLPLLLWRDSCESASLQTLSLEPEAIQHTLSHFLDVPYEITITGGLQKPMAFLLNINNTLV